MPVMSGPAFGREGLQGPVCEGVHYILTDQDQITQNGVLTGA
jgi:hypothetical protein